MFGLDSCSRPVQHSDKILRLLACILPVLASEESVLPDSLLVLGHASIPLVQYRDSQTGLKIDVSFNLTEAVASSQLVNMWKLQVGNDTCSQPASDPPVARPAPPGAGAEAAAGLEGPGHGLHWRPVLSLPHHDGRLLPPAPPQDPGHLLKLGGPAPGVPQPLWQVIRVMLIFKQKRSKALPFVIAFLLLYCFQNSFCF